MSIKWQKNTWRRLVMKEIKIGIVGGCLATLNDVKRSELFYNKIKSNFKESHKLSFSLGSYNDISNVIEEVKRLKEKKNIEYLLFQVRPYVYLKNCRIYLKTPVKKTINPLFFRNNNYESLEALEKRLTTPIHERIANYMQNKNASIFRKYFSFYNFNLLIGYIFNINNSMEKYYIQKLIELHKYCADNNIQLIIHGPVMRTSHSMEPILLNSLTKYIDLKLENINYIATNSEIYKSKKVLYEDGEHVNSNGHTMLADKLIEKLKDTNDF